MVWLGFGTDELPPRPWPDRAEPVSWHWVAVPLWFLLLVSLVMPALALRRWRRERVRRQIDHCRHCGYDLRATPERCPECGHVPAGVTR
jgi:hypothetical protein